MEVPFAFAFTAGLAATLNPCGFAMLPAYLSYFMGLEDGADASSARRGLEALRIGAVVSGGFLVVFSIAGLLITIGLRALVDAMPWIAMVVGVGVVVLGLAMIAGRELRVSLPKASRAPAGKSMRGVFLFGASYAIASLSCTLPVFLAVVAGTIPQLGFVAGVATFLVYGAGMSALLLVVTLTLAFGKGALLGRLRRSTALVNRVAGVILVAAGAYVVFYWATTLRGGQGQPALVLWVEQLSSRAVNAVAGGAGLVAIVAAAAVVATLVASVIGVRRSREREREDEHEHAREHAPRP